MSEKHLFLFKAAAELFGGGVVRKTLFFAIILMVSSVMAAGVVPASPREVCMAVKQLFSVVV